MATELVAPGLPDLLKRSDAASLYAGGRGGGGVEILSSFLPGTWRDSDTKGQSWERNGIVKVSCVLWRAGRIHGLQERPTLLLKASVMATVFPNKM